MLTLPGRRFQLTQPGALVFTIDHVSRIGWVYFHAPGEAARARRLRAAWLAGELRDRSITGLYPDSDRPFSAQMNWHFRRALASRATART